MTRSNFAPEKSFSKGLTLKDLSEPIKIIYQKYKVSAIFFTIFVISHFLSSPR